MGLYTLMDKDGEKLKKENGTNQWGDREGQ